jgi:predicted deacylase
MELSALKGSVVAVIAVNVPGLHWHQRHFIDGKDLNHIFPGRPAGDAAEVYAYRVVERIIKQLDFLVDLHTASFGRVNSLYVRADMTQETSARMAYLLRPQIIVHNPPADSTLRGTAMDLGIPAITVEIGDPQRFQPNYIRSCRVGLRSVLANMGMLPRRPVATPQEPILCQRSYWMYADHGGLLEVLPSPAGAVQADEQVARLRNAFGDIVREYRAPESGVVVGKSVNPVGQTGARILHLGVPAPENHQFVRRIEEARK